MDEFVKLRKRLAARHPHWKPLRIALITPPEAQQEVCDESLFLLQDKRLCEEIVYVTIIVVSRPRELQERCDGALLVLDLYYAGSAAQREDISKTLPYQSYGVILYNLKDAPPAAKQRFLESKNATFLVDGAQHRDPLTRAALHMRLMEIIAGFSDHAQGHSPGDG